jgi:hypothetical protein
VAYEGSWLRTSQISRLRDQSGPMSNSLVARSTSTDCGIAAAAAAAAQTLVRRAPPPVSPLPRLPSRLGGSGFSRSVRERGRARTKVNPAIFFLGCETGSGSGWGPRASETARGLASRAKFGFSAADSLVNIQLKTVAYRFYRKLQKL